MTEKKPTTPVLDVPASETELPGRDAIHMNLSELFPPDDALFGGPGKRPLTPTEKILGDKDKPMKPRSGGRDPFS